MLADSPIYTAHSWSSISASTNTEIMPAAIEVVRKSSRSELDLDLTATLSSLLDLDQFSDFTIRCKERSWPVHKEIICAQSQFFEGACSHSFLEAHTGIMDLSEDDPELIGHMIDYFYKNDYLTTPTGRRRGSSQVSKRSRASSVMTQSTPTSSVFSRPMSPTFSRNKRFSLAMVQDPLMAMATASTSQESATPPENTPPTSPYHPSILPPDVDEKKEEEQELIIVEKPIEPVDDLMEEDLFEEHIIPEQEPDLIRAQLLIHSRVYTLAEKYGIQGLKSLAMKKFSVQAWHHWTSTEFALAIQDVYDSTVDSDRGLRDIVIQNFRAHPELAQRRDVEDVVKETPNLAWELFRVGWGLPVA